MRRRLAELLRQATGRRPAPPARPPSGRGKWIAGGVLAVFLLGLGAYLAVSAERTRREIARAMTGGDPDRAPELMRRYGCAGCHTIPGLPGADGQVGPALEGLRSRVYVGGVARNTPGDLVRWLADPRSLSPQTAMPATGITQAEARDVAAWLYGQ